MRNGATQSRTYFDKFPAGRFEKYFLRLPGRMVSLVSMLCIRASRDLKQKDNLLQDVRFCGKIYAVIICDRATSV